MIKFEIVVEYLAAPSIEKQNRTLGRPNGGYWAVASSRCMTQSRIHGRSQRQIHIVAVIASQEGIDFHRTEHFPKNTHLWIAAIDHRLE